MVGGEPLASPGKRILARIIDGVIWVVFSVIVGAILGAGAIASGGFTDDSVGTGTTIFAGLVGLILIVAYEVFMVANLGGTVGKLVLGMKVRNQDGSPADLNTAGMRIALYAGLGILQLIPLIGILAGLATLIIGIVGLVLLFTDDRRQTPWDKIGKTVVVDA